MTVSLKSQASMAVFLGKKSAFRKCPRCCCISKMFLKKIYKSIKDKLCVFTDSMTSSKQSSLGNIPFADLLQLGEETIPLTAAFVRREEDMDRNSLGGLNQLITFVI